MIRKKTVAVELPPAMPIDTDSSAREKIYAAALQCFTQNGVRQTTMEDIAVEAGFSRPTIYYYFKDKQSLVVEAVVRQQAESHRRHRLQIAGRFFGIEAIVEAAALSVERAMSNPYTELLTRPENERLTALAIQADASLEIQNAFWGSLLADARSRGELRPDISDREIIEWIMFIEFSIVTNGRLFGFSSPELIRTTLHRFIDPALRIGNDKPASRSLPGKPTAPEKSSIKRKDPRAN